MICCYMLATFTHRDLLKEVLRPECTGPSRVTWDGNQPAGLLIAMEDSRAASSAALGATAAPAWPPGGPAPWKLYPENSLHVQALCEGNAALQPIPSLFYMLLICRA